MDHDSTDAGVLARAVAEPAAFEILWERHHRAVGGYVARRAGPGSADDLTSEVFVRAFAARGRYRPELPTALPWLLGVATHVVADHRRLERRRLRTLERLAAAPQATPTQDPGPSVELVRALRRLSTEDRDTLLLVVWGELSYAEVASALGVAVGTVSSRVARARRRLGESSAVSRRPSITDPSPLSNA